MRSAPVLAALLVLGAARARAGEPAVALAASGDAALAMLGTSEPAAADATFEAVASRGPEGRWSAPSLLPVERAGLPLSHRSLTWFVERRVDVMGRQHYAMFPVTGELGVAGVRIECLQGMSSFAVAALDPWTFALLDLGPGGALFGRIVESEGPAIEMSVEREESWISGWPEGTRLIATGLTGAWFVGLGATADGRIVATSIAGAEPTALPDADLPRGGPLAACVTADGPVAVTASGGSLIARAWTGDGWSAEHRLALPAGRTARALAAVALGKDRRRALLAARLDGEAGELIATQFGTGGFGALETVPQPAVIAPDAAVRPPRPAPAEVDRTVRRLSLVRWGVLIAGCVVLAYLVSRLRGVGRS